MGIAVTGGTAAFEASCLGEPVISESPVAAAAPAPAAAPAASAGNRVRDRLRQKAGLAPAAPAAVVESPAPVVAAPAPAVEAPAPVAPAAEAPA